MAKHEEAAEEMAAFDRLDRDVQLFILGNDMDLRSVDVENYIRFWGKKKAMRDFKKLIEDYKKEHPMFDPPVMRRA